MVPERREELDFRIQQRPVRLLELFHEILGCL